MGGFGLRVLGKVVLDVYIVFIFGNKCWICICKIWIEVKNDNEILICYVCSYKVSKIFGYQGLDGDMYNIFFLIWCNGC